jgi:hypothetical protein
MSGTYFNPLDSLVALHPSPIDGLYAVGIEGTTEIVAYFVHKEDAEYFAREGYCYPYKGFQPLLIKEPTQ